MLGVVIIKLKGIAEPEDVRVRGHGLAYLKRKRPGSLSAMLAMV
jgi:hypothetical protein